MWMTNIFLGFIGTICGMGVAGGVFALVISIGLIPRMTGRTKTKQHITIYEDFVLFGAVCGCILSMFHGIVLPFGPVFLSVFGICAGIFVGGIAASLAEILNVFPIMYRRLKVKTGLEWGIFCFGIGKALGAFYFFSTLYR